eukprot:TRINITY_DN10166_c0_g2_i1.p1 TRINITY_DN10166_c0_g2~~TRINITY_DN10166_c0_g2_i1.p1  ORF type:complete len:786 (+),score=361.48 TRINITY_DN10166_c0_g2_i1:326-2683(+)
MHKVTFGGEIDGKAVGAERPSPRAGGRINDDDDTGSVDSGWEGTGTGATFNFSEGMGQLDADDQDDKLGLEKQVSGTLTPTPQYGGEQLMQGTHPTKSPAERRVTSDERMAQSWPPRTPGPSVSALDEAPAEMPSGFTLDPNTEGKAAPLIPAMQYAKGSGLPRAPAPKRVVKQSDHTAQTESETAQQVIISNHATVGNPGAVFCTVVVNGVQLIQCNVPKGEDSVTHAEVTLKKDVCLFGEKSGLFLQLTFYSPNFPAKPEFHVHGTLELLDAEDQIITTIYLGLIEDAKQIEKKQHTLAAQPVKAKVILSSIAPVRVGPNELQLVEEICDVLRNSRVNPGRGSLPSVLVQHRAKESPLYEKVVGKYYQNSWHTFMKAHDNVFSLFHYSQKEIQERKLGPFAKFNEARIVLKEHEAGDWRAADELAALRHAQAEEGLKRFLTQLLEQRDYDQRELLEVLHGNTHFNHFLSPTFSILMRTLCRHKGTFIHSEDPDQPIRIGLSRPEKEAVELTGSNDSSKTASLTKVPQPVRHTSPIIEQQTPPPQQQQTPPPQGQVPQQPQTNFGQSGQFMQGFDQQQEGFKRGNSGNNNANSGSNNSNVNASGNNWAKPDLQQQVPVDNRGGMQMNANGMLVASAVPVQTTVSSQGLPMQPQMMFDQQRNVLVQGQPQQQQQLVQLGGGLGTAPVQLLDQNAAVVLLKGQHQLQQPLLQPQFANQQVVLVNQPSGSDGNWVVTHQTPTQQDLYPHVLQTPPAPPLGSNPSTPGDQSLPGNFYPQYHLLSSTSY